MIDVTETTKTFPPKAERSGAAQPHGVFSFLAEAPWASSRETKENVFWQTVLAKSGVFCHRRDNHSHIYKTIGVAKKS